MEAGLDSLGAVDLRNDLTEQFSVELSASVLFDYPTALALARFISTLLPPPTNDPSIEMIGEQTILEIRCALKML